MDRKAKITEFIDKDMKGLEIGPFHSPLCPKKEGYNCIVLDVFTREQLVNAHLHDSYVMERVDAIEVVDIVSSKPLSEAINEWSGQSTVNSINNKINLDYIVSSHNFEHQPDPIRFLQDVEHLLNDNGILTMAIPIASRCFDCFKPLTTSGHIIDAYTNSETKPTIGTVFDHRTRSSVHSYEDSINDLNYNFDSVNLSSSSPFSNDALDKGKFQDLINAHKEGYIDVHCWQFNPYSFELVFKELKSCGFFSKLYIHDVVSMGCEFIVHIKKSVSSDYEVLTNSERSKLIKNSLNMLFEDLIESNLYAEIKDLRKEAAITKDELLRSNEHINELISSNSWKATAPLRKIGRSIKKLLDSNNR